MTQNCTLCLNGIGPEFKNEYYEINHKIYCSINCYKDDVNENKEIIKSKSIETSNDNKTNKNNKSKNKVFKKKPKSKKR